MPEQTFKIVLLGVAAAITYGVVHDQITARICIEYFSLAHPPIFHTHSLTMLALCWGVASTFFVGGIFGLLLALVSQSEGLPPVAFARLIRGVLLLLATMAGGATLAGLGGYTLARLGIIVPPRELAGIIPSDRHAPFMAVWFVHIASYVVGFLGMGAWIYRLWCERDRPFVVSLMPGDKLGLVRAAILALVVVIVLYLRFVRS